MARADQSYSLQSSVAVLSGVGARVSEHLARISIVTIEDLLFHLPLRYEDRTRLYTIAELQPHDTVMIEGQVENVKIVGKKPMLTVRLGDSTGKITLRFFHFTRSQLERLRTPNVRLCCFGEAKKGFRGGFDMIHPEYQVLLPGEAVTLVKTLTPIYPTTEGLQQRLFRKLMAQALALLSNGQLLTELLPETLTVDMPFADLTAAILFIHSPPTDVDILQLQQGVHPAQQRLVIEELLAHHLSLRQLRHQTQSVASRSLRSTGKLIQSFAQNLSFQLTAAQQRAITVLLCDMEKRVPMMRLLQGDVGSGKTVVAAHAMLQAVEAGFQAALMAPTEILAEQHYRVFSKWFEPLGITVGLLKGGLSTVARREIYANIRSHHYHVVIGTHALFQSEVEFSCLALLVIDEQHRFGVRQRLALREKGIQQGQYPHQLVMTATPIPRSMAMMAYGDLDSQVLDELPPGRQPIKTVMIEQARRDQVVGRVARHCEKGAQAYWICTLVEESESLSAQAAEDTFVTLQQALPAVRVGLAHGRMTATAKNQVMQAFLAGEIDLLVATTVVEVGVDVPQASLMIIENPERLGLAQLHQLRGRVGRGLIASFCVLLYQARLSQAAYARLSLIRSTQDGFEIAEHDLSMRGPGEVLGTRQAGLLDFKVADIIRDEALLDRIAALGELLWQQYPDRIAPLIDRWLRHKQDLASV